MRKLLTQLVFGSFDLLQRRGISKFYNQIKEADKTPKTRDELHAEYKRSWENKGVAFNGVIEKQQIINFLDDSKPENVHSWAYTGGSYGQPLKLPYTKERALLRTATFKYYNEKGGYSLGDSFALIRAKNKSAFEKFLRNEFIIIPTDVSEESLSFVVKNLNKKSVKVLLGYPTVMYELAMYLDANPSIKLDKTLKHLISTSEMLDVEKRRVVKNVFNSTFVDRYANEEVGLIAQQEVFEGEYILNPFNVITEVLHPATLKPVAEGETGKVVVTDTANNLAPMYRYDTGDLAIAGKYINGELRTLQQIIGRESEKIFDAKGKPISSLALGPGIYKPLSNIPDLYQFQFAQTSQKSYELRLKTFAKELPEALCETILSNLKQQLGKEAFIKITKVDEIPPQPSGKRPVYKNETIGCK